MGNMGAHIAHILFFGVPILAAAHMGVPSMIIVKFLGIIVNYLGITQVPRYDVI